MNLKKGLKVLKEKRCPLCDGKRISMMKEYSEGSSAMYLTIFCRDCSFDSEWVFKVSGKSSLFRFGLALEELNEEGGKQ